MYTEDDLFMHEHKRSRSERLFDGLRFMSDEYEQEEYPLACQYYQIITIEDEHGADIRENSLDDTIDELAGE